MTFGQGTAPAVVGVLLRPDEEAFIDLLYETAARPEGWPAVLERLADLIGGTSVWLSRLSVLDGQGSGILARIDPRMTPIYESHYAARNPLNNVKRPDDFWRDWRPKILVDEDWMPKQDLVRSEYYNDFLRPQEIHSTMMIRLAADRPTTSVININRPKASGSYAKEDIERAERLHPDLIRAFKVGQRLAELEGLNADLAAALDASPDGVFVLDAGSQVRHVNRTGQRMLAPGNALRLEDGRLRAQDTDGDRRLRAAIAAATARDRCGRRGGELALPAPRGGAPLTVTLVPRLSGPEEVFGRRSGAIAYVSDPNARSAAQADALRGRFGFTPAEIRVAQAVGEGASPRQAAERLGVSFHTVRHQLQSIYEKAGVNRQSELVLVLTRALEPQPF